MLGYVGNGVIWFHGVQDYSWEDHGYSLVNRLLPDMGQLLDEKFQVTFTRGPSRRDS